MKILFLLSFLGISSSYALSYKLVDAETLSQAERQRAEELLFSALEHLPPSLQEEVNSEIPVEFTGADKKITIDCQHPERGTRFLGKTTKILGKQSISLNRGFLGEVSTYSCKHKNSWTEALATLLHETGHAYEGSLNARPSSSRRFKSLVYFMKNNLAERSPDPYEFKSYEEAFAVNLEYFLLDPEFKCRKPGLHEFFADHFSHTPFKESTCKPSRHAKMHARVFYVDFNPKRLYQIDYLMAGPGKALMSRFGHSMVRLVFCKEGTKLGPECLKDVSQHVVLSFRANISGASNQYLGGLTGSFPSQLFVINFSKVSDEYNRDEFRNLLAYPLKLTQDQKEAFLKHALTVHWSYTGKYYFTHNNCAVETKQLIAAILPEDHAFRKTKSPTPADLRDDLYDSGLIDEPKLILEHPGTLYFKTMHKQDLRTAVSQINSTLNQELKLEEYLKSSAVDRKEWFSRATDTKVKMSFFTLELQISKKINGKLGERLNKLLKRKDLELEDQTTLQDFLKIQAKLAPWESIRNSPYGIVARDEIDIEAATKAGEKFTAENQTLLKILKKYEPEIIAEYDQTNLNLDTFFK